MRRPLTLTLAFVAMLTAVATADPGEHVSTLADQRAVGITIYNNDLALVRDRRRIALPKGESHLALRDVSAKMQPETALLQSASGKISVLEQNFDYDLLTPQTLLEKYVGRDVDATVYDYKTNTRHVERARVLATGGGVVLRFADRIETGYNGSNLSYPSLPENLRDRPTLVTDVTNTADGEQDVDLTYLSGGLSWKADYTAQLSAADDRIDLRGLVTLHNVSGTTYRDASVQLVAGDVNVVRPLIVVELGRTLARSQSSAFQPAEQALLEYHLYTLGRRTTIADNQTKQVELLTASGIPVTKSLELRSSGSYYYSTSAGDLGTKLKLGAYVTFRNAGGDLGIPLPAGTMRVYKRDSSGTAQFVGGSPIDHTAKGETVRLYLGNSFDVTASKKQTDFRVVDEAHTYESAYQIVLSNAKKAPEKVLVVEPIPGDWAMLSTSAPFEKTSASTATWSLSVPPEGTTTLTYRVRTKS
jgi:hypothetical protein